MLNAHLARAIAADGGWWPFDRFMHGLLYTPGLGYYARGDRVFGRLARDGSDFVTAPEMGPAFARALARQVAQALEWSGGRQVVEFGAGSGALAEGLLKALAEEHGRHDIDCAIVELSAGLRAQQQARLAPWGDRVQWLDRLPERVNGVLLGNEVLDAMPAALWHRRAEGWVRRGVALQDAAGAALGDAAAAQQPTHNGSRDPRAAALASADSASASASASGWTTASPRFVWADEPGARGCSTAEAGLPEEADAMPVGSVTEHQPQAAAFVATLAGVLERGLALFIDYGFPAAEYYHPQRHQGTLMCHRGHQADADPLSDLGQKDVTVHVDFTAMALAGQAAGLDVAGYTSQARFLANLGLLEDAAVLAPAEAGTRAVLQRAQIRRLLDEHEMGELFKVLAFTRGLPLREPLRGFAAGDRLHRL